MDLSSGASRPLTDYASVVPDLANLLRTSVTGQQLPLYARYSPECPCSLKGIVNQIPMQEQAFRNHALPINLETLPRQPRGHDRRDDPADADRRGPKRVAPTNAVDVPDVAALLAGPLARGTGVGLG